MFFSASTFKTLSTVYPLCDLSPWLKYYCHRLGCPFLQYYYVEVEKYHYVYFMTKLRSLIFCHNFQHFNTNAMLRSKYKHFWFFWLFLPTVDAVVKFSYKTIVACQSSTLVIYWRHKIRRIFIVFSRAAAVRCHKEERGSWTARNKKRVLSAFQWK